MSMLMRKIGSGGSLLDPSPWERSLRSFFAGLPGFPDFTLFDSKVEIETLPDKVVLQMPAPGCDKKDFNIELAGDFVTIKVERTQSSDSDAKDEKRFIYRERSTSEFEESVKLPVEVTPENAKAEYVNGVLTVTIPRKAANQAKNAGIKIEAE